MSEHIAKCNEVVGISGKAFIFPEYIDTSKEIVRCRDCNSYEQRKDGGYCHHFSMFDRAGWPVEPDGFCKWAERKEVDE